MKAVQLSEPEWKTILEQISKTQPKSVYMIRSRMKQVLGFTPREHEEWVVFDHSGDRERRMLKKTIHLDFYNESQRTMFLLKYSDLIGKQK